MAINTSAAALRVLAPADLLAVIAEVKSETDHYLSCAIRSVLRGGDTVKVVEALTFEFGNPKGVRRDMSPPHLYGPAANQARIIRAYQNWEGIIALVLAMEIDRQRCGV